MFRPGALKGVSDSAPAAEGRARLVHEMATRAAAQLFESGLDGRPEVPATLESIIRQSIAQATGKAGAGLEESVSVSASASPASAYGDSVPRLEFRLQISDLGKYLSRTAMIWAQVTEDLSSGPHVSLALKETLEDAKQQSGLSNWKGVSEIDETVERLRYVISPLMQQPQRHVPLPLKTSSTTTVLPCTDPALTGPPRSKSRDLAAQHCHDMLAIWRSDTPEPEDASNGAASAHVGSFDSTQQASQRSFGSGVDGADHRTSTARMVLSDQADEAVPSSPRGDLSTSDESDGSEDDGFESIDMTALMQRGKGAYTCPKGLVCTKGGVDPVTNSLVIFDRNSAFK